MKETKQQRALRLAAKKVLASIDQITRWDPVLNIENVERLRRALAACLKEE